MKKIVFSVFILLMLSGCSINYELEFKNGKIKDNLQLHVNEEEYLNHVSNIKNEVMPSSVVEYFSGRNFSVFKHIPNIFYTKEIKNRTNGLLVNYSYDDYDYSNYNASYFLNNCFSEVYTSNEKDFYFINAKGPFLCYVDTTVITVRTDKRVIDTNGVYNDGVYTWEINKENVDNIDLVFQIDKNEIFDKDEAYNKANKDDRDMIGSIVWIIVLSVLLVVLIILYKKIK